jgi:adenylosuccinate synthase
VVVRYSARINGLDALALTKLDVLDGLPEVKICVAYKTGSGLISDFPADLRLLTAAEPQYETLPGWTAATKGVTDFARLPPEAQRYVRRLEEVSGVDCAIISTGSDRTETIVKEGGAVSRWISHTQV